MDLFQYIVFLIIEEIFEMKKYCAPEMEIIKFMTDDVITASGVEVYGRRLGWEEEVMGN
ncbi:MAG: hypothetical protein ACI4GZ_04150 [Ruminococcus sp.]